MKDQANKNRHGSFFPIPKEQFEYCLIPLWFYTDSSKEEISSAIKIPLTEISNNFNNCLSQDLIQLSATKLKTRNNFKYTLSDKGQYLVRKILKLHNEVA